MCLAVPGKIIKISQDKATVDYGTEKRVATIIDDEYALGDYVIVQGKIVITKVSEKEAKEALKLYTKALKHD